MQTQPELNWNINLQQFLAGWWKILNGRPPMLSIEITRECPLSCPGCYAYGEQHLGAGGPNLREVSDLRGQALVDGVVNLVRRHRPLHVSLVGGEPMVRHKELSRILPVLSEMGINILVVTSAVIPIPREWMRLPGLRVAVSVDGLPEHHDARRKPATYERILRNIQGCEVNIHWTVTHPMLSRGGYLEEYLAFWNARQEVNRIWASIYSPQAGERTAEMLSAEERRSVVGELLRLGPRYPKLLMKEGMAKAYLTPPLNPGDCLFSRMSTNYTADLKTRVEPCVLGGQPDCAQCGCVASVGLHWINSVRLGAPLKIGQVVRASMAVGRVVRHIRATEAPIERWGARVNAPVNGSELVQIAAPESPAALTQPKV